VVEILGEDAVTVLGDNTPVEEKKEKSPTQERSEDHNSIVVTGKLSTALADEDILAVRQEADGAVVQSVQKVMAEQGDQEVALEKMKSQSAKAALVAPEDFFASQLKSLQNEDETDLESLTALKIQYAMTAIDSALDTKTNPYGQIANFVDRFLIYEPFYESWLKVFGKSDIKLADQFTGAITGNMTLDEFKVFMDGELANSLGEGSFIEGNPHAVEELRNIAMSLGNNDPMVVAWMFALLDVVPMAGGAVKGTVKVGQKVTAKTVVKETIESGPTVATQVGRAARSAEEAEKAAVKIAGQTDDVENVGTLGPRALNNASPKAPFHPTINSGVKDTTGKNLLRDVLDYTKRALSGGVDEAKLSQWVSNRQAQLDNVFNRSLSTFAYDPLNGVLKVTYGRADNGLPLSKRQADRIAADTPEAKVVPDGEGKFYVEVEQIADTDSFIADLTAPERIAGIVSNISARLMKGTGTLSTYARDSKLLSSLAERAETGVSKIAGKVHKEVEADIKKLAAKDMDRIGSVINKLQSEELARQKAWMTEDQFAKEWTKDYGSAPFQKVVDGYNAIVKASNFAYALRAGALVRRMHRNGFRTINLKLGNTTESFVGKQLDTLPSDAEFVVRATDGTLMRVRDLKKKPKNVFKVDIDIEGGYGSTRYVIDTDSIRSLEPTDVLGFNAGGPRINPEADYFITLMGLKNEIMDVTLSAGTRKQAEKAVEELQRLIHATRNGYVTDEFVEAHSKWNKYITTKDDFLKFLEKNKIDIEKVGQVAYKMRDDNVFRMGDDAFVQGAGLDDFYMFSNRRNNNVLTHFGGERTFNENPIKSIMSQVNTASRQLAYSQYNQTAMVSIGRKVKSIVNKEGGNPAYVGWTDRDYLDVLDEARFAKAHDPLIKQLKELKRIFELRSGADGLGDETLRQVTGAVSEVLTKSRSRLDDPVNMANRYSFYTTFMFDPFQTVMQGLHSFVVVGMGGPIDGPLGMMLGKDLMSSLKLKRGVELENFYVTHAKKYGMTPDELKDTRETFVDLARYEINSESLVEGFKDNGTSMLRPRSEAGRIAMHSTSKAWDVSNKVGMAFFNKGEQVSRVTGFGLAAIKRFKKGTGTRMNSPEARDWIVAKEQAYTLRMTQTNKGAVQHGIGRATFQFHSFMFKAFEGVMVGKGLSAAERLALFGLLAPVYGTIGLGLANSKPAVEAMNYFLPPDQQITPGSQAEKVIRRGLLDGLASWAGVDTAIADRMSVVDGVQQFVRNFNEKSFMEFGLGAGGGKTIDTAFSLGNSISYFIKGDSNLGQRELLEAFRQVKGVDNMVKAKNLYFDSLLKTKTGNTVQGIDVSLAEAILVATGVPIAKIEDLYNVDSIRYATFKEYKEVSKSVDQLLQASWAETDPDKRAAHLNSAAALIEWSRLTEEQQAKLKGKFWRGPNGKGVSWKMYMDLVNQGLGYEAEQLAETFRTE